MNECDYDVTGMINQVNDIVQETVNNDMTIVKGDAIGIDRRAGYCLYVNEYYIAVETRQRASLDYYGGFEYVDEQCVTVVGDYVFYSHDDERVAEAIAFWERNQ